MSTVTTHRAVEFLVGIALLAYCAYELHTGQASGAFRSYDRHEEPGSYWTSMLLKLGITAAFLFGFATWRD
ncbi:MAG TPA: hypothetical protein VMB48_16055 [Steroidobacteraceae bacterium]|nr:hypothetical protein [Steroidobacteraceae bacterium]